MFTGPTANLRTAVLAGAATAREKGLLVRQVIIPGAHPRMRDVILRRAHD